MKGGRKLSNWNLFVKKIYNEGKISNSNYDFKQALSDASKRKSEMNLNNKTKSKKTISNKNTKRSGKSRRTRK